MEGAEYAVERRTRYRELPLPLKVIFLIFVVSGIVLAIFYLFGLSFMGISVKLEWAYYYLLIALFSTSVFLLLPARKKDKGVRWYDLLGAGLAFGLGIYFYLNSWVITAGKWSIPFGYNTPLALIMLLLVLEGGRRMGGNIFLCVCVVLGLYPIYASYMPGILEGISISFSSTLCRGVFSVSGLMGLPAKVLGEIIIAFLTFAGVLIASGAGKFFLNLAFALLGRFRGGPAKVATLGSAFFGSLSGGAITNVLATGSITIPTMKRIGYPPEYAGAIEACASTGGVLMPPIMGAVAFIMAEFLEIEYAVIITAAFIPAVLYYVGLLMQVDAYAAKVGLKGLPRKEIPSLKKTLAEGWPFITVIIFLLWGLLYMRWEQMAAFYAAGLMFLLSFFTKENKMTPRRILDALITIGTLLTSVVAILLPIGIIINGLMVSGAAGSFAAGLVYLAAGNMFVVILLGVGACYIMGMAGLVTAAYILLGVTMGPVLVNAFHLNQLAVHLFILYYAMLAAFTPPVAGAAFVAGAIAQASPMRVALRAMRLGVVIYIVPFFFLFNPALILQAPIVEIAYFVPLALLGIFFIAAGMEGYLLKVGTVKLWARPLLILAGLLIAAPELRTTVIGLIVVAVTIVIMLITKRRKESQPHLTEYGT